MGFGRTGERNAKGARGDPGTARHLHHEVAPRFRHPIHDLQMRVALDPGKRRMPARIDLDAAFRPFEIAVMGTVRTCRPRGTQHADEIDHGIEGRRTFDGDFAGPNRLLHRAHPTNGSRSGGGTGTSNTLIVIEISP